MTIFVNIINIDSGAGQTLSRPTDTVIVNFVYQATLFGLQQLNSAKLALKKGKISGVKSFASTNVKAYARINARLNGIVAKKEYDIPAHIDQSVAPAQVLVYNENNDFDQKYISLMLKDNKKMLDLFTRASIVFTDPDLKGFIKQTLPVLQKQLRAITVLYRKVHS